MKKLIDTIWNGEPVVAVGAVVALLTGLAAAAVIPVWVGPVAVAVGTALLRQNLDSPKTVKKLRGE